VEGLIGRGGMSVVHLAGHGALRRKVALNDLGVPRSRGDLERRRQLLPDDRLRFRGNRLVAALFTNQFDGDLRNRSDVNLVRLNDDGTAKSSRRLARPSNEPEADPLLGGFFIGDRGASPALLRLCPFDVDYLSLRAFFASPDLDPPRLGLRGNRYLDCEHALFVAGLEPLGVKVLAEEHLALERAHGPLLGDDLVAFFPVVQPLGGHTEHVLLDGEVDRVRVDAGEIEMQEDHVPPPVGIHRDRSNLNGSSESLLGEAVQIPERIEAHDHWVVTPLGAKVALQLSAGGLPLFNSRAAS
jgi:hypothetical protein